MTLASTTISIMMPAATPDTKTLFEAMPPPDIEIDYDSSRTTYRDIVEHPLARVWDALDGWGRVRKPPQVHVSIVDGAVVKIKGRLWTNLSSIEPIHASEHALDNPVSQKSTAIRGKTEHPWESHERSRNFFIKYTNAGVNTGLVEFIFDQVVSELCWQGEDTPKLARLWLTIAAAVLQQQQPDKIWFAPHIFSPDINQALSRCFGVMSWQQAAIVAYSLWSETQDTIPAADRISPFSSAPDGRDDMFVFDMPPLPNISQLRGGNGDVLFSLP